MTSTASPQSFAPPDHLKSWVVDSDDRLDHSDNNSPLATADLIKSLDLTHLESNHHTHNNSYQQQQRPLSSNTTTTLTGSLLSVTTFSVLQNEPSGPAEILVDDEEAGYGTMNGVGIEVQERYNFGSNGGDQRSRQSSYNTTTSSQEEDDIDHQDSSSLRKRTASSNAANTLNRRALSKQKSYRKSNQSSGQNSPSGNIVDHDYYGTPILRQQQQHQHQTTRPLSQLRPATSSDSIASDNSNASNTTNQTFMSTISFRTVTGGDYASSAGINYGYGLTREEALLATSQNNNNRYQHSAAASILTGTGTFRSAKSRIVDSDEDNDDDDDDDDYSGDEYRGDNNQDNWTRSVVNANVEVGRFMIGDEQAGDSVSGSSNRTSQYSSRAETIRDGGGNNTGQASSRRQSQISSREFGDVVDVGVCVSDDVQAYKEADHTARRKEASQEQGNIDSNSYDHANSNTNSSKRNSANLPSYSSSNTTSRAVGRPQAIVDTSVSAPTTSHGPRTGSSGGSSTSSAKTDTTAKQRRPTPPPPPPHPAQAIHRQTTTPVATLHHYHHPPPPPPPPPPQNSAGSSRKGTLVKSRSRRFSAPGERFPIGGDIVVSSSTSGANDPVSAKAAVEEKNTSDNSSNESAATLTGANRVSPGTGQQQQQHQQHQYQNNLHQQQHQQQASTHATSSPALIVSNPSGPPRSPSGESFRKQVHKNATHLQPQSHQLSHQYSMQHGTGAGGGGGGISGLALGPSHHHPSHHHDYRPGVVFEYYEGEWDWLPNFDEMVPSNAGIVRNIFVGDKTEVDLFKHLKHHRSRVNQLGNFAVRFTTHIDITQDGVYTFWLSSNDGSTLFIANNLVVENDGMHYTTEVEGRIMLTAGKHALTVEFFHCNGKLLEGFKSTGPSLTVSYRAPGSIWSLGLATGPKQSVKDSMFFYDYGDLRCWNLLNEFRVVQSGGGGSTETNLIATTGSPMIVTPGSGSASGNNGGGVGGGGVEQTSSWHTKYSQDRRQSSGAFSNSGLSMMSNGGTSSNGNNNGNQSNSNGGRVMRNRIMSGESVPIQATSRELQVQVENARTTIQDLEQIIRDQALAHQKKMDGLYSMLKDSQQQVQKMKKGLKSAKLFEAPNTKKQNETWRSTVVSIYMDAEEGNEDFLNDFAIVPNAEEDDDEDDDDEDKEEEDVLGKHLADLERLKQMYFFSMALSVKMNFQMLNRQSAEYTSTSIQKLYEECSVHARIPVEGWPGFVSRYFGGNRPPSLALPRKK